MNDYIIAGSDIAIGKEFSAKHWTGTVVFGREAIYLLPDNITIESLKAGYDSKIVTRVTRILGETIGVVIEKVAQSVAQSKDKSKPASWQDHIIELQKLPSEVLSNLDWPVKKTDKRPVIVIKHSDVVKIGCLEGKIVVEVYGTVLKLCLRLFGYKQGGLLNTIKDLGWGI